MRSNLGVRKLGLSISAVLAILYTLVMLTSVLLVGFFTAGSWQADLLGLEWQTLVGIELGLLVLTAIAFTAAILGVSAAHLVRGSNLPDFRAQTFADPSKSARPSWAMRSLAVCFLLPVVVFPVLHAIAAVTPASAAPARGTVNSQNGNVQTQPVNLGPIINTSYREAEPSFTADGRTMYFNCYNGDICSSHSTGTWEQAKWTPPERLGAPVNTEYEEVEPVINRTGDLLYFTSIRPTGFLKDIPFLSAFVDVSEVLNRMATRKGGQPLFGGLGLDDIWVSHRVDGIWSEPQNINDVKGEPPVNTPYADHCLFFSADGNEAFWTSTRPGGFGGNDVWTSHRVDGKWTTPENLGPNVNGPGSEHAPTPTPDGRSLYVTSDRPGGFGGDDIYITTRGVDGKWGPLVSLGAPVNGPGDDRCPAWTPDLKIFLFDSIRGGGRGARDIWWLYFKDVRGYPLATTSGGARVAQP
jgi:WD40 repeat protein